MRVCTALVAMLFMATACADAGDQPDQSQSTEATATATDGATNEAADGASDTSVSLVLGGTLQEPWSLAMHEGGTALTQAGIAVGESLNTFDPVSAEPIMRQFLQRGTDVLVAHNFTFTEVVQELANDHPDVVFAVSGFIPAEDNLHIHTVNYLEVGYANCWLLARLSESNVIGTVGAVAAPYEEELSKGCAEGAKAANPEIEVLTTWSQSFEDGQKTREQAQNMADQGADGIWPMSAAADSIGGFLFCEERQINCVGWASDAAVYAPSSTVNSVRVDWSLFLNGLVEQAESGDIAAETYTASFSNGGLAIVPPLDGPAPVNVPSDVMTEFETVVNDLAEGNIDFASQP